jgi:two-component sensor histidine kinase
MVTVVSYHRKTREFALAEVPPDGGEPELTPEKLKQKVRQQQILADFGVSALKGTPFPNLLQEATRLAAEGLGADFAKALEYLPEQNRFLVCAGVGWGPGIIGAATIGADTASPAGYALRTGQAVISNHLDIEERFRTPELLVQYGIRRAMNVILQGNQKPFGVLEVDSQSEEEFSESDIVFLRGLANILGMAIERQRVEANLRDALEHQQLLIKEVNHRVNNSLQIVASMLHLQSSVSVSEEVKDELHQAAGRIAAIARAHQQLYRTNKIGSLDLGNYLADVCKAIEASMRSCDINIESDNGVVIRTDRAIPAALLMNELITNAAKYAYAGGNHCAIWVTLSRIADETAAISVRDEGVGLPADFDLKSGKRLGMRLVNAFTQQLQGDLKVIRRKPGTEFLLTFPIDR